MCKLSKSEANTKENHVAESNNEVKNKKVKKNKEVVPASPKEEDVSVKTDSGIDTSTASAAAKKKSRSKKQREKKREAAAAKQNEGTAESAQSEPIAVTKQVSVENAPTTTTTNKPKDKKKKTKATNNSADDKVPSLDQDYFCLISRQPFDFLMIYDWIFSLYSSPSLANFINFSLSLFIEWHCWWRDFKFGNGNCKGQTTHQVIARTCRWSRKLEHAIRIVGKNLFIGKGKSAIERYRDWTQELGCLIGRTID